MCLAAGQKAPGFSLQNTNGDRVQLSDYKGKNLVLLFFPLAFSGTCTLELCNIRDNMKLYEALSANVVAISVDSFFTLNEFKKSQNLNFTLLSDFNREASKDYGVLYEDYYGMKGVAKRSAFIIDEHDIIQYAEVLEDSSKLPDFDTLQKKLNHIKTNT